MNTVFFTVLITTVIHVHSSDSRTLWWPYDGNCLHYDWYGSKFAKVNLGNCRRAILRYSEGKFCQKHQHHISCAAYRRAPMRAGRKLAPCQGRVQRVMDSLPWAGREYGRPFLFIIANHFDVLQVIILESVREICARP